MRLLSWLVLAMQVTGAPAAQRPPSPPPDRIEIILFSDFQCPFCQQLAAPIRELEKRGIDGTKVSVVFKHFPLSIHPKAQLAHQAALAAEEQGKFWEIHDLLFANQRRADRPDLLDYARQIRLDMKRFEAALDSDRVKRVITDHVAEGSRRGVGGTPTFYVNGKEYVGARTVDQLVALIGGEQRIQRILKEVPDTLLSKGPPTAPVTIELFADLQSPVSRPTFAVVNQLLARHAADVRVQFRNYPLAFHPQSALAHEAAIIAAREGRFWEFADFILSQPSTLREQELVAHAGRIGINQAEFARALQERRYKPRVDADLALGQGRGIKGSPSIVIDGKRIDGVPSLTALEQVVTQALAARTSTP
jgi:protein-disulfide isomerase